MTKHNDETQKERDMAIDGSTSCRRKFDIAALKRRRGQVTCH